MIPLLPVKVVKQDENFSCIFDNQNRLVCDYVSNNHVVYIVNAINGHESLEGATKLTIKMVEAFEKVLKKGIK